MKKLRIIFIFFIWIISNPTIAQDGYMQLELSDLINQLNWNNRVQPEDLDIAGSPYLDEDFKEGDIYMNGKYKISKIPLRYNLHNDEFQFKNKTVIMAIADPGSVDKIVIGNEEFIYLDGKESKTVSGYVRKWNNQLPAVITKMRVEFFEQEKPKPYTETKPNRFERALDKHYLMKSENEIEHISSVKKLVKSLGDHQSELLDFAKKEKISTRDPAELARLLDFYQTLK